MTMTDEVVSAKLAAIRNRWQIRASTTPGVGTSSIRSMMSKSKQNSLLRTEYSTAGSTVQSGETTEELGAADD